MLDLSWYPLWAWALLSVFIVYCITAFLQLVHHGRYLREGPPSFPRTKRPVSVILGILSSDPELDRYLRSVCEQDYPEFEVLLVSTLRDEPGASVGEALAEEYSHVRHIITGAHDPSVMVGKNHALLTGIVEARNDIVVFCDADVLFESGWLQKMVSPLGRKLDGRTIHAVGGPIFILPRNRLGRTFALGANVITYLASFARPRQVFPAYVSGHSMAIRKDLVMKEVAPYWAKAYNDDLILAFVLRSTGRHLYYRRDSILWPEEDFSSWKNLINKTVRWAITVRRYQHRDMSKEAVVGVGLNSQAPIGVLLALVFLLNGIPCLALLVFGLAWGQAVAFRYGIAGRLGEKYGVSILLTPLSYLFFGTIFLHHYLWGKRFRWGSHEYRVERTFGMDSPRDNDWLDTYAPEKGS